MARVDMKWGGVYGSGSKMGRLGNTEKRVAAAAVAAAVGRFWLSPGSDTTSV